MEPRIGLSLLHRMFLTNIEANVSSECSVGSLSFLALHHLQIHYAYSLASSSLYVLLFI